MNHLVYQKMIQEGDSYSIGYERGAILAKDKSAVKYMTEQPEGVHKPSLQEVKEQLEFLDHWCPGAKEEVAGLAEGMQVTIADLLYLYLTMPDEGNKNNDTCQIEMSPEVFRGCSIITVMPDKSANGHTLMARNYEYDVHDELIYSVTRCEGKLTHAGFSLLQLGRFDGINEKGVCIAMSGCECVHSSAGEGAGVSFYVVLRSILDQCTSTKEALEYIKKVPVRSNCNLMVTDPQGDSAVIEILNEAGNCHKVIRKSEHYIYAVNHYQSKEITSIYPQQKKFSQLRATCIEDFFKQHDKVTLDNLKQLLTDQIPAGLCCHAYSEGFGTLRSILFDVTDSKMWAVLGSPQTGTWFLADLKESCKTDTLLIPYQNDPVSPDFFSVCNK